MGSSVVLKTVVNLLRKCLYRADSKVRTAV